MQGADLDVCDGVDVLGWSANAENLARHPTSGLNSADLRVERTSVLVKSGNRDRRNEFSLADLVDKQFVLFFPRMN